MRKAFIGVTPLLFALAACAQTASKPAGTSTPSSSTSSSTSSTTKAAATPDSGAPAPPAHPLTDVQAHELMTLTGTDKIKEELLSNMLRYINQAPFMPKDVGEDLRASMDKADINTAVVGSYKKYLSTEDAAKAIDFYKSPAGRDLIKANPAILGEAQHSAMQTGQQIMREVIERHRPEIEAAQKSYQAEHTPAKPPSLSTPAPGNSTPSSTAPSSTPPKPQN